MTLIHRVLDEQPCVDLDAYIALGGGDALRGARAADPVAVVDALRRSGLRGRGGAGFPTATKWASVLGNTSHAQSTPVVINGAEGEPSTFKDRMILRTNPYRVLEGALSACAVLRSYELIVCLKRSFVQEWERLQTAVREMQAAGWLADVSVEFVAGPDAYLFGEETGLLEVIDGRQPFPRVAPPWRRGLSVSDADDGAPALATMASAEVSAGVPALVNNVETFADVALIIRNGPDWFREIGTTESPGSVVCTVVGDVTRCGVGEFAMGTPLREVIETLGGGPLEGRTIVAVLPGASSAVIAEDDFDTPLTYEGVRAVGSALGSAGFLCIDDSADTLRVARSVARFLSVESCGQCTPCKDDGLAVAALLTKVIEGDASEGDVAEISGRLDTITNEARCSLAGQQQTVIGSLLRLGAARRISPVARNGTAITDASESATEASEGAAEPVRGRVLAPLIDIIDGVAVFDENQANKQPDWTFDAVDSGVYPAQRLQGVPCDPQISFAETGPALQP